jgi:hypothetical protein
MKYLKAFIAIFLALSTSRFIPHPPNFTSLIALSFYVPVFLGIRYLPVLILCFVLTDFIIGLHSVTLFTWGSVIFIGLLSQHFHKNFKSRISGVLISACLFYLITNFGVWISGSYEYTLSGLALCYTLAIPFFGNTLLSTIFFSSIIEIIVKGYSYFNINLVKSKN